MVREKCIERRGTHGCVKRHTAALEVRKRAYSCRILPSDRVTPRSKRLILAEVREGAYSCHILPSDRVTPRAKRLTLATSELRVKTKRARTVGTNEGECSLTPRGHDIGQTSRNPSEKGPSRNPSEKGQCSIMSHGLTGAAARHPAADNLRTWATQECAAGHHQRMYYNRRGSLCPELRNSASLRVYVCLATSR